MQRILSPLRKAVEEYNMIEEGDNIAVGLSGGKDSITLLMALKNLQLFYPKSFNIKAITINPGFNNFNLDFIKELCCSLNIPLIVEKSNIKEIVFDIRKEKNPCSLCANLRRGILNSIAIKQNCNKIALGHNLDDAIETFFLSLLYNGNIHTFSPVSFLDKSKITVIRPLIYTKEKEIQSFINRNKISVMPKCCSMDGISKREDIKQLIKSLEKNIPSLKANLLGAIKRKNISGW